MTDPLQRYIDDHRQVFLEGLCDLVRRQTVSTDPAYAANLVECAGWLVKSARTLGLQARIEPTRRHPCVLLRGPEVPGAPRVLVYGHYDVQPAEDLDLWKHPPFEPRVEGECLHGRGASDNKGQIWAWLCALQTLMAVRGALPVNLAVLIEGEEEIGSPHLAEVLSRLQTEFQPDVAIVSDTSTALKFRPTVHYSLRGLVVFEVHLRTARMDVHSGVHGGVSPNAVRELTALVSRLHDAQGRVAVPGFYDRVRPMEAWEEEALRALPFDEAEYAGWMGAAMHGEAGFSTNERRWFRPTLECNGILGGYTGEGSKTIVPCSAMAKFSARLVADQEPQEVMACLKTWFEAQAPPWVELDFVPGDSGRPYLLERQGPQEKLFEAARRAVVQGFGEEPLFCRHGGAIPITAEFQRILGAPTLLLGLGSPDDAIHAPNEKFELRNFYQGVRMAAEVLEALGEGMGEGCGARS